MKMSKRERAISIINSQNKLEMIQTRQEFISIDNALSELSKSRKKLLGRIHSQESEFRAMQQPGALLDLHRFIEIGAWLSSAGEDLKALDMSIDDMESALRTQLEKLARLEAAQEVIKQKLLDERALKWAELESRAERDLSELTNAKNAQSMELSYGA
ncbi:hypothetical protein [Hahella chejuensis]|nr:hypothetical protein [Hahella chejuensis]